MIIATFKDTSSSNKKAPRRRVIKNIHSSDEIEEVEPGIDENVHGWAYIGSANFTPSAWGTLSGSAFNTTLNVGSIVIAPRECSSRLDHELRIRHPDTTEHVSDGG